MTRKDYKFTIWKVRKSNFLNMQTTSNYEEEWVKILSKGLMTIPKSFREALGLKKGEVAKVKKIGRRLIIEPRDVADYEVYSDPELKSMLKEDRLPVKLSKVASSFWPDLE